MKKYIDRQIFKDELQLWFYLQSLKNQKLEVPDGCYSIELAETDEGLRYKNLIYKEHRQELRKFTYELVISYRCFIFIENGQSFCIGIQTPYFQAQEEVENGRWTLLDFHDDLCPSEGPQLIYTEKDYQRACDALVEALVVSSKKVA